MQSSLALQLPPKARQPSEIVWHTINEANAELGGKSAAKPGLYYSCLVSNRRVAVWFLQGKRPKSYLTVR